MFDVRECRARVKSRIGHGTAPLQWYMVSEYKIATVLNTYSDGILSVFASGVPVEDQIRLIAVSFP